MYKDRGTKTEAKIFALTCFFFILTIFTISPMVSKTVLTDKQLTVMCKKNFLIAFFLSAYYFNTIFNYLIVQVKLAQEASASKARFLSIMSHELRTPLNGIISAINLIDTTTNTNEKKKYGEVLRTSSDHLLQLVNNVLDYSKAASGKMELNLINCSLEKILQNLKIVFEPRFEEKGILLEIFTDPELKRNVLLDDIRFVQVLTNLLSNSLKFTEKGKVVVVARYCGLSNGRLHAEVSVTDTGKGLTGEQQKTIFDSFNNVHNKTTRVESSGLGLSISKMIIEMMGGALLLESQPDRGSKFYFNVNLQTATAEQEKIEIVTEDLPLLKGVKILIAEDNAINMMVTCEFLKRWEMTIITAEDGKAAQQKLLEHQDIDVALLDLQMPGMDGYELMAWIKEEHIEIPVIAFTAQIITNEGRLELQQTGFVDIMPKPFDPKTLGEKIRNALVADKVFS